MAPAGAGPMPFATASVVAGAGLAKAAAHDVLEHVVVAQLEDQEELGLRVDHLVEANHVRVLDQLHAEHLATGNR